MALSRDLSLVVAESESRRLARRLKVWDALAATGVRSLRWLRETQAVDFVLATEGNPEAVEVIEANARALRANGLSFECADAREGTGDRTFDLVDVDPYGTPQPFLPAALRSTSDGGVLGVTATDMAVLAGPERVACQERYGGVPVKGPLSRESGLRILLAHLDAVAQREHRSITPLLSYIGGYYVRVFVRVGFPRSSSPSPPLPGRVGPVPYEGYDGPPLPSGPPSGPMWLGRLHEEGFVKGLTLLPTPGSGTSLERLVSILQREVGLDVPFYYEMGDLSKRLHLPSPPPRTEVFRRLASAGWRSVRTHASPSGWRTDGPGSEVSKIVQDLHW